MSARTSMEISIVRRVEAARPLLRVVETPARQSRVQRPAHKSDDAPRTSLFALRTPPELGLLSALVFAAVTSAALGYLSYLALSRWVLALCM